MVDIPTIETERLILRGHRNDDFDAYAAMWADPEIVRLISGVGFTREQSWSRFLRHAGIWHHLGFGFFALEDKASGAFVGEAGFHDLRREIEPPLEGALECGWAISREAQGRGLAVEAMRAALAWADAHVAGLRRMCIIDPRNGASLRIAEKLGFEPRAKTSYHDTPIDMFERPLSP